MPANYQQQAKEWAQRAVDHGAEIDRLRSALKTARQHIVTLGGDCAWVKRDKLDKEGVDRIQWAVLYEIDAVLGI